MFRVLRSLAAALALTALTAGAVHALPARPRPEPAGLFEVLREWAFARLLPGLPSLREKEGCEMDPNGAPLTQTPDPGATIEAGLEMDPDG